MYFGIDIEINGHLEDLLDYSSFPYKLKKEAKLWCVVIQNFKTGEVFRASKKEITKKWMEESLEGCTHLVAHNGIKFDFITLKLFGVFDYTVGYLNQSDTIFGKEATLVDTLILSRLFNPDRFGGHALAAWGYRLGEEKTDLRGLYIEKGLLDKKAEAGAEFKIYSEDMVDYCITPNHKLLRDDLRWTEARYLKVGDKVLGFDEFSNKGRNGRRYRSATIEKIKYEKNPVFEVTLSSGKKFEVTEDHKWLTGKSNLKWLETKNLRVKNSTKKYCTKIPKLMDVWEEDKSYEAGWLSGMFDGEGTLAKSRFNLTIAQRPTKVLDKIENILSKKYSGEISKRYTKKNSDCRTIGLKGSATDKLKFLGEIRPERIIDKFYFEKLGRVENRNELDEVISVEPVGIKRIIKIQTSTNTFICDGYPMHNCEQDVVVNEKVLQSLAKEFKNYPKWRKAIRMESKLADLAVRREHFGFFFNREKAIECVRDLTEKINTISDKINPILPERELNKGELSFYTPPKVQLKKDGTPSAAILRFAEKHKAVVEEGDEGWFLEIGLAQYPLPFEEPLETHTQATVEDMDTVKAYLIDLGWIPSEWNERDLTKDAKKKNLPYKKRVEALERWLAETFVKSKYKEFRLEDMDLDDEEDIREEYTERLKDNRPVRVRTSPPVKVGVERELCPNLVKLGKQGISDELDKLSLKEIKKFARDFEIDDSQGKEDLIEYLIEEDNLTEHKTYIEKIEPKLQGSVLFAKDFANYLTYRYRRAAIAGGDLEGIDLAKTRPEKGYLATYRDADGRIATPAIEIGAVSNRYIHKNVVNIPRTTSLYGREMRQLFGAGKDFIFFGYDFASIEARISGHYVYEYKEGKELAKMFAAEKPNDLHTVMGIKLGIPRSDAKSINFAILYGAQPKKIAKMLAIPVRDAKRLYNEFWEAVPALKQLKNRLTKFWEDTGKVYIMGIDGRKIFARSPHSLINFLFQSGAVIMAKYVTVKLAEKLENRGYNTNPFEVKPDICSMIEYHDEQDLAVNPQFIKFKKFKTEEEAKSFVTKWKGDQLSPISKGKNCWFVVLPNVISESIMESINELEEYFRFNVEIAYEYMVGRSWAEAH